MQLGLTLSVLLHVSVLAWAMVSFNQTSPLKIQEPEPVEVALITPDELVRLRQGDRSSKNLETAPAKQAVVEPAKKEAPKPKQRTAEPVAAAPPPPPPEPEPVVETPPPPPPAPEPPKTAAPKRDPIAEKIAAIAPPPPPGPAPEEIKRLEDEKKAEQERQAEAAREAERKAAEAKKAEEARKKEALRKKREEERKKQAERRRKEEERRKKLAEARKREEDRKKKEFDPGRISALLNKIPETTAKPAGSETPPTDRPLPKGPAAGAPEGRDTRLTASQRSLIGAMMKQAVSRCWRVQAGLEGADRLVVDVEVRLKPDGSIDGLPRVVSGGSGALFADAANRAVSALLGCAPYDLPKEVYKGGWDHMVVTFDPQKMF